MIQNIFPQSLEAIESEINRLEQSEQEDLKIQKQLYNQFVVPKESQVFATMIGARNEIDAIYQQKRQDAFLDGSLSLATYDGTQGLLQYPAGYCGEIQRYVLESLQKSGIFDEFEENGGIVMSRFLAYDDGKSIGSINIIQAGDRILDTGAEEFSDNTLPIAMSSFLDKSSRYREFDIDTMIQVSTRYHKDEVFDSREILGGYSTFFPLIKVHHTGEIKIMGGNAERLDNFTDKKYLLTKKWILENSKTEQYTLPQQIKDDLIFVIDREIQSPISLESSEHRGLSRQEFVVFLHRMRSICAGPKREFSPEKTEKLESQVSIEYTGMIYCFYLERLMDIYNQYLRFGFLKNPYKAKVHTDALCEPYYENVFSPSFEENPN